MLVYYAVSMFTTLMYVMTGTCFISPLEPQRMEMISVWYFYDVQQILTVHGDAPPPPSLYPSHLNGSASTSVISGEEQFEDYGEGEDGDYIPRSPEDDAQTNGFSDRGSSPPSRLVVSSWSSFQRKFQTSFLYSDIELNSTLFQVHRHPK